MNRSSTEERQSLLDRYSTVRPISERLCQPLATEVYAVQSMPDASPAKWHLAHTSWFFEQFILVPDAPSYASSILSSTTPSTHTIGFNLGCFAQLGSVQPAVGTNGMHLVSGYYQEAW